MAKIFVLYLVDAVALGMIVPGVSAARRSWPSFVFESDWTVEGSLFDVSKRADLVQNHR